MGPRTQALRPNRNLTKEEIEDARRIREEETEAAIQDIEKIRLRVKRQVVQAAKEACEHQWIDAFFFAKLILLLQTPSLSTLCGQYKKRTKLVLNLALHTLLAGPTGLSKGFSPN